MPPRNPLDVLKARPGVAGWIAVVNQTIRHESYFNATRIESERRSEISGGRVTVFKDNGNLRGKASFEIAPGRESSFETDIDQALLLAGLGGEPRYPIAGKGEYTKVILLDPELRTGEEFFGSRARADVLASLREVPGVRLADAEFFLSKTKSSVVTSEGAAAGNDISQYRMDLVFLAGDGPAEAERHTSLVRKRYQDLEVKDVVKAEAQRALDRVGALPPAPGAIPVVFSPGAFGGLVDYLVAQTSGRAVYLKQTPLEIGRAISPGSRVKGEPLILEVNALFPFGPGSYRIDPNGVAARNLRLIDRNVFVAPHTDPQFAHYLKFPEATGAPGTPQIPPGRGEEEDLLSGDHLEVIGFSDLVPSSETGRFSAEIRFGYQVTRGKRRPVAGGTLSGNILEIFSNAHYSKEVGLHDDYVGPNVVRFEEGLIITV